MAGIEQIVLEVTSPLAEFLEQLLKKLDLKPDVGDTNVRDPNDVESGRKERTYVTEGDVSSADESWMANEGAKILLELQNMKTRAEEISNFIDNTNDQLKKGEFGEGVSSSEQEYFDGELEKLRQKVVAKGAEADALIYMVSLNIDDPAEARRLLEQYNKDRIPAIRATLDKYWDEYTNLKERIKKAAEMYT